MAVIHLLVPALWVGDRLDAGAVRPRMPALSRLLGRAVRHGEMSDDADAALFSLFGTPAAAARPLPIAAATHWADFANFEADAHQGCWLRIDPVHLRPDLGKLLLFDGDHLDIGPDEVADLLALLNEHLAADELTIVCGDAPQRWYVRPPAPPRLDAVAPWRVNGRHIDPFMPRGPDARVWHRRVLELQMLLHGSAVNAARERHGRPAINSVWPWGGGELGARPRPAFAAVVTADEVARGLARAAGVTVLAEDAPPDTIGAVAGDLLFVPSDGLSALRRGDATGWAQALERLDERLIAMLHGWLWRRRVASLEVYVPGGICRLQHSDLLKFWRRAPGPFAGV